MVLASKRSPPPGRRSGAAPSRPSGRPRGSGARPARKLHASLADEIGRDIVGGVYPPDSLLPSATEMCARFSVSRTALREGYSVLAAKAMIVARPKIGTRVRPKADWNMLDPEVLSWHLQSTPTESFVSELFVLRQMVEPEAAGLAAGAHSRITIERIEEAYARMDQYKEGAGDLIGADLDFHMRILEATGNHFITALGGLIRTSLECVFELSWEGASRIQEARLQQHRAVLAAICEGIPGLAKARMQTLLTDSLNDVRLFLHQQSAPPRRPAPSSKRRRA